MQFIKPDVSTICVGQAASMGAVLLAGGAKGKRFCLPHSRIMIHQPLGGFQGQAVDFDRYAKEILQTRERLNTSSPSTPAAARPHRKGYRPGLFHEWRGAVNTA